MNGCRIEIKAVPNAPKSEVIGWLGDALKVKIHAPPVEGKANQVLCEFLAGELHLPKRAVKLFQGDTSRKKVVAIEGMTREQVVEMLL